MTPSSPFVDKETGAIDRNRVFAEAIPLAKLIGLIVAATLVPFALMNNLSLNPTLHMILTLATQFIVAVGAGIVLIYIISRSIQLISE